MPFRVLKPSGAGLIIGGQDSAQGQALIVGAGVVMAHPFRFAVALPSTAGACHCMKPSTWILPVATFTVPTPQIWRAFTHA
jgi:hypothetical protein